MALSDSVPEALRLAWQTIKDAHGRKVTIDYGVGTLSVVAVKTRPNAQAISGDDVIVESNSWDFLVEPASLIVSGKFLQPKEGWEITEQDGAKHRLIAGDSNNLVWRYSDQHKTWVRMFAEEMI